MWILEGMLGMMVLVLGMIANGDDLGMGEVERIPYIPLEHGLSSPGEHPFSPRPV